MRHRRPKCSHERVQQGRQSPANGAHQQGARISAVGHSDTGWEQVCFRGLGLELQSSHAPPGRKGLSSVAPCSPPAP